MAKITICIDDTTKEVLEVSLKRLQCENFDGTEVYRFKAGKPRSTDLDQLLNPDNWSGISITEEGDLVLDDQVFNEDLIKEIATRNFSTSRRNKRQTAAGRRPATLLPFTKSA